MTRSINKRVVVKSKPLKKSSNKWTPIQIGIISGIFAEGVAQIFANSAYTFSGVRCLFCVCCVPPPCLMSIMKAARAKKEATFSTAAGQGERRRAALVAGGIVAFR